MTELSVIEWIERAKLTLDEKTSDCDDTQLADATDDLINAIRLIKADSQHWIIRVQDSINEYREIQTAYFDGTQKDAAVYFASDNCKAVSRYMGNMRYQITMQANPVCVQYPE